MKYFKFIMVLISAFVIAACADDNPGTSQTTSDGIEITTESDDETGTTTLTTADGTTATVDGTSLTFTDKGKLSLKLIDAPIDADVVEAVYITVTSIALNNGEEWYDFEGFEGPQKFNLLDLTGGVSASLGSLDINSGIYTQIRLMIDAESEDSAATDSGCYIMFTDNTTRNLKIPSGSQTGIKIEGPIVVADNKSSSLTLDFDVRKSIVVAGKDIASANNIILKPVLRLINEASASIVDGSLDATSDQMIVTYIYTDGSITEEESSDGFENAVGSVSIEASQSEFSLPLLEDGIYDLVFTSTDSSNGEYIETLGYIDNFEVVENTEALKNLDITQFVSDLASLTTIDDTTDTDSGTFKFVDDATSDNE